MSKRKDQTPDLGGDITKAIFDLGEILIVKAMEVSVTGLILLWNHVLVPFVGKKLLPSLFKRRRVPPPKKIERRELRTRKATLKDDHLGYSVSQRRPIELIDLDRRRHTMICGASGFGKSVLLDVLMYDDMRKGKPVIFIDPKGDRGSLKQFINLARLARRKFQVFSESYDAHGAIALNPAKEGRFTHIADRIHYAFNWSEEHYETLCYRALKTASRKVLEEKKTPSFENILERLESGDFERKNIEGLISRLENIVHSDFGGRLAESGLSLKEVWEGGQCVYIGLPVLGLPMAARALGKMILGDLSYAVYDAYRKERADLRGSVGVYMDELSAVITDEFIELLNKCRAAKMELTFAFQCPNDINKINPHLCEQILENSSNWFIFKQRVNAGADLFAQAIGTAEGVKQTVRVSRGEEQDQGSQRRVEELIAHHNIIKNLRTGQTVLLRHSPTEVDLVNVKYIDPKIVRFNIGERIKEGSIPPLDIEVKKNVPSPKNESIWDEV
ncbi:MAG: ATP-binding protein [Bacteriovoracales bacterium]|nr:ATP-binding protein [Bacteriovoracales bacterium]